MAIYQCNVKVIKRSAGKSSVAAAAYRAGAELHDEQIKKDYDYTRKEGVVHTEILAPADALDWVFDRGLLWNTVEKTEKRKDSQLAREVMVALPIELDQPQQLELLREFCKSEFVDRGMIADVCVHRDQDKDPKNPHAHIMLTMRTISADGHGFGDKNRAWNTKEVLQSHREAWADCANRALEAAGSGERIDHRTLHDQGIDRVPQVHLGAAVAAMKARGIPTDRGDVYDAIEAENELRVEREVEADLDRQIAEMKIKLEEEERRIKESEPQKGEVTEQTPTPIVPPTLAQVAEDNLSDDTWAELLPSQRTALIKAAEAHRQSEPSVYVQVEQWVGQAVSLRSQIKSLSDRAKSEKAALKTVEAKGQRSALNLFGVSAQVLTDARLRLQSTKAEVKQAQAVYDEVQERQAQRQQQETAHKEWSALPETKGAARVKQLRQLLPQAQGHSKTPPVRGDGR